MSQRHSQDDLLNEFLDQLTHDINTPAPIGLDDDTVDFARRLAISEQTPPASHNLQHQIWDQLMASQPVRPHLPSSNGNYPHKIQLIHNHSNDAPKPTHPPRWSKPLTRIAAALLFLIFGATLVYIVQTGDDASTQTSPINGAGIQSTSTSEPTHEFNPEVDTMSLPPNQDQPEVIEVNEPVTNTIESGSRYVYVLTTEARNIYTVNSVSDQQVILHYRILNRPAIGGSGLPSGGGGGGSGGGGDSQDMYYISGSISVIQDSVLWLSIENTNSELPATYTLNVERFEFPKIEYGDVVSEPFVPSIGEINWQFEGQSGDIIGIAVESDIDTSLRLEKPDGTLLISDDDSGTGLNPEIYRVQLPSEGEYRITVRPHGGWDMNTTAQISLTQYEPLQFVYDTALVQLSTKHTAEVVTFEGIAGEHVRVEAEAISSDTMPLTSINIVQNGEILATMDLLPNSYDVSSGTGESSSTAGTDTSLEPQIVSREFVTPTNGTVSIFINMSSINTQNSEEMQYVPTYDTIINLIRLD